MNNRGGKDVPHFDVQLLFDEIGILLDRNQYRDVVSLLDMFHFYSRQHQYRIYRPPGQEFTANRSQALLRFAGHAILGDIRERNRRWTWAYFAERREDRKAYVDLFKKQMLNQLVDLSAEGKLFRDLERKLSYEDIRFYRSIARSQLRKDIVAKKELQQQQVKTQSQAPSKQGWGTWIWGSASTQSSSQQADDPVFGAGTMTDAQKKELYDMLDYNEQSATTDLINEPRDALKARVVAKLNKGSFALQSEVAGKPTEIISIVFDLLQANVLQRPDNLACSLSLGGFGVFDRTSANTIYPQIAQVKDADDSASFSMDAPFFTLDFENNPLDGRADTALSVKLRPMEIVYHRGYVEAIYEFFRPPESQLESVEALLVSAVLRSFIHSAYSCIECRQSNFGRHPSRHPCRP
jgi:vacuolar protein sorting-associated protein 13A/C